MRNIQEIGDFEEGSKSPLTKVQSGNAPLEISSGEESRFPVLTTKDVTLAANIDQCIALQKNRVRSYRMQNTLNNACASTISSYLSIAGLHDGVDLKALNKQARAIAAAIEKDEAKWLADINDPDPKMPFELQAAIRDWVGDTLISRKCWDDRRARCEKAMVKLEAGFPAHEWRKSVRGFGAVGHAIIIGEAGDLTQYATKERVWKRLGLAVINGKAQGKRSDPDEALLHGYNPERRAEMWTLADSLIRQQRRGEKDGVPAHTLGKYGEIYDRRKAHTAITHPEWLEDKKNHPGRAHKDAMRVAFKELVADLWREWRRATIWVDTSNDLPSANDIFEAA